MIRKSTIAIVLAFLLSSIGVRAQDVTVNGTVTSNEDNLGIPGVSVVIVGTSKGTTTDFEGKYSVNVPKGSVLKFSFVGYKSQEKTVGDNTVINVVLDADNTRIDEVIVTALGIKREKKALGYSVQDVKGDELNRSNNTNVVSSLSGKIAGAQITTSSGQVGASSTIKIRGNKSFEGSSQPLFVVDGTPIMNSTGSARDVTATDFGNAAMDIDPANIESISVLKGPSATALYGSRATNGVILITTKKGAGNKGVGVSVSSSLAFDEVFNLPNYQNEYGQGMNGDEYNWKNTYSQYATYQEFHDAREFRFALDGSGNRMDWDESWGSRLDVGLLVDQMHGKDQPWVSNPDNVKNFYEMGITSTNNVALTANSDKASGRFSFGYTTQKGTMPNTDQKSINLGMNTSYKLSDKLRVDASVNYVDLSNDNLPQQGNSMRNPLLEFNSWFGRQLDMNYLKDHYEDIVMYNGEYTAYNWMMDYPDQHNNPYWLAYKNTMQRNRNRTFGNIAATYTIASGIELMARVGTDFFAETRKYKFYQYSRDWTDEFENAVNGTLWQQKRFESETNADIMLNINKNINDDISLNAVVGANYRYAYDHFATVSGVNLVVPNFFSVSNLEGEKSVSFTEYHKKTNSVFASANLGYKNYLFLDLTMRGDWSSTLPSDNWNYWYPSVNLGFVFTDALGLESTIIDFGKIRAGYAIVGDDTSPYQLKPTFWSVGTSFNGVNLFSISTALPSATLKPQKTASIELGVEMKFFGNRLGVDATYYSAITSNQLLNVPISPTSGYDSWMKNAGEIENKGVEIQLYGTPVKRGDFVWDINLNWSKNENTVLSLDDGIEELTIANMYQSSYLMAFPNQPWGAIYGKTFKRNDAGQVVVNASGRPIATAESHIIGNVNPDWIGGMRNTFAYKDVQLTVLLDMRHGGDIVSMTKAVGQNAGILQSTVEGGQRENGMIVEGVYDAGVKDDSGNLIEGQPNTTVIAARTYWRSSRNFGDLALVDGSYIKLREVAISYNFNSSMLQKIRIQGASLSVFGRNLAILYKHESNDVNIDPEVSTGGSVAGTGLEAYQLPPSRTIGVKLNFNF